MNLSGFFVFAVILQRGNVEGDICVIYICRTWAGRGLLACFTDVVGKFW